MRFSIVTASLRQLGWLKRCVRSVADQGQVCEHIVQDGGSGPELETWLAGRAGVGLAVEKDGGLYDALNRGFARATGDVCGWLNCDEQYLPGALGRVREYFLLHPEVDMVCGDFLLLDAAGKLLAFRKATPLRRSMILSDHLYNFSCATFFRRRVLEMAGPFDTRYRAAGDADWVARALAAGARTAVLPGYLAAFTFTGENLSQPAGNPADQRLLAEAKPRWARLTAPLLRQARHLEKFARGGYRSAAIRYAIYVGEEDADRTEQVAERPDWRHPWL